MKELKKLIDLKSMITLFLVVIFGIGFINGKISTDQFIPVLTMIMTFYFARTKKKEGD